MDDDADLLNVSKKILCLEGNFEIDTATTVEAAIEKMHTTNYDAVISDYEMPQRNGLDFLTELRTKKTTFPSYFSPDAAERKSPLKL